MEYVTSTVAEANFCVTIPLMTVIHMFVAL